MSRICLVWALITKFGKIYLLFRVYRFLKQSGVNHAPIQTLNNDITLLKPKQSFKLMLSNNYHKKLILPETFFFFFFVKNAK